MARTSPSRAHDATTAAARTILRTAGVVLVAFAAMMGAPVASPGVSIPDTAPAPWTAPTWVAFEHSDVDFDTVAVALGDDGHGLVVYSTRSPSRVIWAASVTPDGTIEDPAPVSWEGVASFDPKVAIAAGGRAVIAWSAGPAASRRIEAVTRSGAGAAFSKPVTLSPSGGRHALGDVVLEPGGTAVIAWTRREPDGNSEAQIARLGRRVSVRSLGAGTHSPVLAVSPQLARASMAWAHTRGRASELWLQRDGGDRVRIARARRSTSAPAIAAGSTVVATWLEGSPGVHAVLRAARLGPDGQVRLDEIAEGPVTSPSLAAAGSDVAVGWLRAGPDSLSTVYVARSTDASSGFEAGAVVSPADDHAAMPSVAVGGGRVAAVWNDGVQPRGAGLMCGTLAEAGSGFTAERILGEETDHVESTDPVALALNAQGAGLGAYLSSGGDVRANGHVAIVRLTSR